MPDQLTLDVIDRPSAGVLGSFRGLGALHRATPPGMRALIRLGTARFVPRPFPAPTFRRIAILAAWDDGEPVEERWSESLGRFSAGAREHWHLRGEVARAAFTEPWARWQPSVEDARPLDDAEPALIVIAGDLHARHVPAFMRDAQHAVAHAFAQPGYLGGLAINSGPLNTTSCSAWRTYADAKTYAYKPGGHAEAMLRDRADERHRTEWFLRIRPLEERGTLNGAAPFASVLRTGATA